MIATIKTKNVGIGHFEAMKHGVLVEPYGDGSFDLISPDIEKIRKVAALCDGKIVSIVDRAAI
jgi:hypothetical protein